MQREKEGEEIFGILCDSVTFVNRYKLSSVTAYCARGVRRWSSKTSTTEAVTQKRVKRLRGVERNNPCKQKHLKV